MKSLAEKDPAPAPKTVLGKILRANALLERRIEEHMAAEWRARQSGKSGKDPFPPASSPRPDADAPPRIAPGPPDEGGRPSQT